MRRVGLAGLAAMLALPHPAAAVQPVYDLLALPGLTDAEHTDDQGSHVSSARRFVGAGLVFGETNRVAPGAAGPGTNGVTSWAHDPATGTTSRAALDTTPYAPLGSFCINGILETTALGFGLGATTCGATTFPGFVWAWDGQDGVKTLIGLADPDHVSPTEGRPLHRLLPYGEGRIARSGHVAGATTRFSPALGESAWLYDPTTRATTRIGLLDADHTGSDGSQWSSPWIISSDGNVAGYSDRYLAGAFASYSAWIHVAATGLTRRIGLYDGDGRGSQGFTASDGRQATQIAALTDSAYAAGSSTRYQGALPFEEVSWLYRIADDAMLPVGLTDPMHTRADGAHESGVTFANDAGQVVGSATRFDGGSDPLETTPWLFDVQTLETKVIGLYDAAHTSAEGLHDNRPHQLSESGYAAGSATRPSLPGQSQGTSVWVAHRSLPTTRRIGLVDGATLGAASFTSTSGEQTSEFVALLESGDVLGSALAYAADQAVGSAAWFYDASTGTTRAIGLYGPGFIAPDGSFASASTHWTGTGFVAGYALRSDLFRTLWIYSAETDQVAAITPPTPPAPGGFVSPEVLFLGDDGTVVGRFGFFDGQTPQETVRFFAWTADGGTVYLDERIDGGFEEAGWVGIETIDALRGGRILGSGRRADGDVDGFMLTPLPEPSATPLLALGVLASAGRSARRQRDRRTTRS